MTSQHTARTALIEAVKANQEVVDLYDRTKWVVPVLAVLAIIFAVIAIVAAVLS